MHSQVSSGQGAEEMLDLNDLRIFAYVAALASFTLAAEALSIHKSSVSRSVARLEALLGTPLIDRTSRKVELTRRGIALRANCIEILSRISDTIDTLKAPGEARGRSYAVHAASRLRH